MRLTRAGLTGLATTVLLFSGCQRPAAAPAALSEEDKTAIRAVFSTAVTTLRAGDFDAFLATFEDDVVFQPANAAALHGKDALRTWVTTGPKPTSAFDFTNVEVNGEGNLAFATSAINMALEGIPVDPGKQLVVLRKNGAGEWKTVAVSFNSDTPMPMPDAGGPTTTTTQ